MSEDSTEAERRALRGQMPERLNRLLEAGEPVWTKERMLDEFTVEAFAAPIVIVRRKSDGRRGTLVFTDNPRYYFEWEDGGDECQA